MPLQRTTLDNLDILDEPAFAALPIYGQLKAHVVASKYPFLVPDKHTNFSWDRALFLNLTFWNGQHGADVLVEKAIPADVVAHVAWHLLTNQQLEKATGAQVASAAGMFLGESIASAFDLYLLGKLIRSAPGCDFVTTQVPIMAEAAELAGLPDKGFERLLEGVASDPERAFEDLRSYLMDVTQALLPAPSADAAQEILENHEGHRFAPLLHHYQVSNWLLYARAYSSASQPLQAAVAKIDAQLRIASSSVGWLQEHWLA
jgi:hypothetical protein